MNIDRPYDDPISLRLREELRRLRREKGWSIYDLSRAAEVSPSFISMVENGHKAPDPRTIERIAGALGMDPGLTRAWMTLRGRPQHPQEAIDAAYRLMDFLEEDPDAPPAAASAPPPPLAFLAEESPRVYASMSPPDDAVAAYVPEPSRRAAEPPSRRADSVAIPVVPEGTAPQPPSRRAAEPSAGDPPLLLDHRLLPSKTDLRGAFAWRLTREGIARIRGEYRRGDYVVIAPRAWEPVADKLAPPRIFAVRIGGKVVLSRVTWGGGQLILLPAEGGSDYLVRPVADEASLRKRIMGRVVASVRKFPDR